MNLKNDRVLEAGKTTAQDTGSVHLLTVLKHTDVCTHTLTNTHTSGQLWLSVTLPTLSATPVVTQHRF